MSWFVDFEYETEGHCTGPWKSLDDAIRHIALVAERLIWGARGDLALKSITVRDEQ